MDVYKSEPNEASDISLLGTTENVQYFEGAYTFKKTYGMDYYFEKHQHITVEVFWEEEKIETIRTTLGRIMGTKDQTVDYPFQIDALNQKCFAVLTGVSKKQEEDFIATVQVQTNLYGSPYSDYFVVISTCKNQKIWKSEEKTGKEFIFKASDIMLNDLCAGDMESGVIIEFFRVRHGKVSQLFTTLNEIHSNSTRNEPFLLEKSDGMQIGTCKIDVDLEKKVRFIDYVESGMEISLSVGIDFTSSNGNPRELTSLHYIYGNEPNSYEQAISACGSIITCYDSDQSFPVYGFGALLGNNKNSNHCFNLTFRSDPRVQGLGGIINAYKTSLSRVQLDGPTYFCPLIKKMVANVKSQLAESLISIYFILLILTDGQIHDMIDTRNVIAEASHLPISIIIIGIGDEDFTNMIELDGDNAPLKTSKGEKVERDIVQFVCYNDFKIDSLKLSEEVLKEVPKQVEQYYRKYKNFKYRNTTSYI